MWSNDMKYKYMFMIPLNNLARKGLTAFLEVHISGDLKPIES